MSILNDLKKSKQKQSNTFEASDYVIHPSVFEAKLFRLGVDKEIINDCLQEDSKIWPDLLKQFENKNDHR